MLERESERERERERERSLQDLADDGCMDNMECRLMKKLMPATVLDTCGQLPGQTHWPRPLQIPSRVFYFARDGIQLNSHVLAYSLERGLRHPKLNN